MTDVRETKPEHDGEFDLCGELYLFRRSHELLRRIEQKFGALMPLAQRVERMSASQSELAMLYEELIKGDVRRQSRIGIERWIWDEGTPKVSRPLARILYELPLGNKTLRLLEEEKRIMAAEQREREDAARPTTPPHQDQRRETVADVAAQVREISEQIMRNLQTV